MNIETLPAMNATTARPPACASPVPTQTAMAAAIRHDATLPMISTLRRRRRSAIAEPIGPTNAPGIKPAAVTTAAELAFPVVCAT